MSDGVRESGPYLESAVRAAYVCVYAIVCGAAAARSLRWHCGAMCAHTRQRAACFVFVFVCARCVLGGPRSAVAAVRCACCTVSSHFQIHIQFHIFVSVFTQHFTRRDLCDTCALLARSVVVVGGAVRAAASLVASRAWRREC